MTLEEAILHTDIIEEKENNIDLIVFLKMHFAQIAN